ncbi:hypothetical protein LXD69_08960 [Flavobacterium sediminilitoris]|uniref:Uncharacterized protein n=1 Tax=Flavobacterium sediminilitoris TaxID=2024526 RepID=A0ABY4HHH2_9FLAO|nr:MULTISPECIES: hypothetical protein [Flavobacterium]UOX32185.1 hypothetical protein LXD69_08960 [Flavobacterium sediminilitoris]
MILEFQNHFDVKIIAAQSVVFSVIIRLFFYDFKCKERVFIDLYVNGVIKWCL